MRGADVASDHHLVVANIRLKLKKSSTHVNVKRKFDVGKLQDPKFSKSFKLEIKNGSKYTRSTLNPVKIY